MSMEHPEKQKNAVKSVVDQVMDGIISQIIDGTLHPGDKLPTEMELCKQFGAGRNSVREAVKKLQAYGILYIKRADGTFVSENYNQKMLDPMLYSIILQKNSWQEFVELRSVIDIGTLNIIIQRNDITSFLPDLYRTFGELSAEMHSPEPSVDKVLELARLTGAEAAVLKERSPSCGSGAVYDGTFSGTLTAGWGVAAGLLREQGIRVLGESRLEELLRQDVR